MATLSDGEPSYGGRYDPDAGLEHGDDVSEALEGRSELGHDEGYDRYEIFLPAVQSLVNAIGGYEEVEIEQAAPKNLLVSRAPRYKTVYRPGDSVLAVLKDLKRLWRKDDTDDERTVARCMAKAGLMRELVSLLVECHNRGEWGRKVSLVACDLIAALTWPIDVQSELKEMADEPDVVTDYASLLRSQIEYKATLLQSDRPLRSILALLLPSLAKQRKDERDEQIISLGLHIVRNLLAIKDVVAGGTDAGEKQELANLQSTLLTQLDKLTYFQLLLTIASGADRAEFNPYNVLVLDILHLVFRGTRPRDLSLDQDRAPINKLAQLLDTEHREQAQRARSGMTRHSRFGTTVSVRAGEQRLVLHKQNAITVNAGKMLDEVKRKRAGKLRKGDELSRPVELSPEALKALQVLAKSFIESCFNTFIESLLKDIRMERQKVRDTDNVRLFFLAHFMMEYLLILYNREQDAKRERQEKNPLAQEAETEEGSMLLGYAIIMVEMDSVKWVFNRIRTTLDDRPPAWVELQACLNCFTQILLLLETMSVSGIEDDVEAAEILQNSLYYNYDILDTSITVVAQYKDQSIGYLDSIVHFAYVLLRMLERYSKNKSFMFVRKREAQRKKKKQAAVEAAGGEVQPVPDEEDEEMGGEGEEDRDAPSYGEHQFKFREFEMRFAQESVVNTLLSYLQRFQQFDDPDQMKRVVGLIHRQVVKSQAEGLYFKVAALHLFQRIIETKASLHAGESTKDLLQLITFILRKFFKRVQEDPFLIIEALAPKTKAKWKAISSYKSDESDSDGAGPGGGGRRKEAAELEFVKKKNLSWSQQMEVVIGMLIRDGKQALIEWIIEVLELACAARTDIVFTTDGPAVRDGEDDDDEADLGRNLAGPSKEAIEKFTQHDVDASTDDQKNAVLSNAHFRLMLILLSLQRTDDITISEQKWFVPTTILPSALQTSIGALKSYLANPPTLDEDPKSLLRRRRRQRRARTPLGSDEEAARQRTRKKKHAETQVFKSAAFIVDSDDDEETDRVFFETEKRLRAEMDAVAKRQGIGSLADGLKKRKRLEKARKGKGKGKAREDGNDGAEDAVDGAQDDGEGEEEEEDMSDAQEDEDIQSDAEDDEEPVPPRRKRRSVSRRATSEVDAAENEDEDSEMEDETPRSAAAQDDEGEAADDEDDDAGSVASIPVVRRRQMSASGSPAPTAANSHYTQNLTNGVGGDAGTTTQRANGKKARRVVESDED